jgi:hypothetical protein
MTAASDEWAVGPAGTRRWGSTNGSPENEQARRREPSPSRADRRKCAKRFLRNFNPCPRCRRKRFRRRIVTPLFPKDESRVHSTKSQPRLQRQIGKMCIWAPRNGQSRRFQPNACGREEQTSLPSIAPLSIQVIQQRVEPNRGLEAFSAYGGTSSTAFWQPFRFRHAGARRQV